MSINCLTKIALLLMVGISWSWGCTAKNKNPLLGSWQSSKMETLREIRGCGAYTENQIELITSKISFGDVLLEIDEETISSYYEGTNSTGNYKILSIDEPFVLIESYNPITDELEILAIEVKENRLWLPSSAVEFREVFTRVQ